MRIGFVEPHLLIYGGIRRIIELSNGLIELGHDVTIFHSDGSPCEWMKCAAKVRPCDKVLNEVHDVLIYNDPVFTDYRLVKNSNAKLKVYYVLELYERDLLKGLNYKILLPSNRRIFILKLSLHSPYLKLSNATWMYRWLKENLNVDSKLLIGGVNEALFHPVKIDKKHRDIVILCSGDPRKRKGTATALKAVEIAKREEPRIVLDTYHGKRIPQDQMAKKYCSADIFIDAQRYAGWNNPVAEAMACRVPVVCTDIGAVQDFAFHERTALLVPVNDPDAMASAILRIVRNQKLRDTLRDNAYDHIRRFTWDESATRLEQILDSELKKPNPSHGKQEYPLLNLIPGAIDRLPNIYSKAVRAYLRLATDRKTKMASEHNTSRIAEGLLQELQNREPSTPARDRD